VRTLTISDPAMLGSAKRSYAEEVLADSPAGLWMLDETSGTTAIDVSGNGRNGTYQAGFTLAQSGPSSMLPNAVALTGEAAGTGLVEFPNSATSALTSNYTIGLVVKFDQTITTGLWNLLSLVSASEWSQPFQLSVGKSGAPAANNVTFRVGAGTSNESTVVSPATDLGTTWHHLAARCSGTTYSVWLDGVSIGSNTSNQARSNSGQVMGLGRRTAASGQRGRTGKYAGLYIIGSAVSDARIAAHARAAGL